MSFPIKISFVLAVVLLLSGCASNKLVLNLDLYKEDPVNFVPLTPARVVTMYDGLALAEMEAEALARDRIDLADQLFATYESLFDLSVEAADAAKKAKAAKAAAEPAEGDKTSHVADAEIAAKAAEGELATKAEDNVGDPLVHLRAYLKDYKSQVTAKAAEVTTLSRGARSKLEDYLASEKSGASDQRSETWLETRQIEALRSGRQVVEALVQLGGPLGTDFEDGFVSFWPIVVDSVSVANLAVLVKDSDPPTEFAAVRTSVDKLYQTIKRLEDRGRQIPKDVKADLAKATTFQIDQPGAMKRSVDEIAKISSLIPPSVGLGDRGATAVNELVRSTGLFYSQIDRLQDPGDPVWRVVSSPENKSKWNKEFSKTYFYAEGNSSVVVVRDSPISYRVQRGNNNPSALVQGQLQVSRAISDAAISVAAASTGVPLPTGMGTPQSNEQSSSNAGEAEALASRQATIQREASFRSQAVTNFVLNLESLKDDLSNAKPDETERIEALLSRLQSVLDAHKSAFTHPEGERPSEAPANQ